jgi:3-oxoacyl-[acyl-carrier-protein] synthase-3
MFRNVHIVGVGSYHPQTKVENQYFINHFKSYQLEDHAAALMNKLGRVTRTLAGKDETSLTMAVEAAKVALNNSGLTSGDIDMIISVSDTPEYLSPCCALLI